MLSLKFHVAGIIQEVGGESNSQILFGFLFRLFSSFAEVTANAKQYIADRHTSEDSKGDGGWKAHVL